jgi:hypothetical protein
MNSDERMSATGMDRHVKGEPDPPPGSRAAIEKGCICPVLDNCHGKGIPTRDSKGNESRIFWRTEGCPLHG